jgi:uncharacterized membrane protein
VNLSQWLLAVHVSGAFLFLGGGVLAAVFNVAAQRSERPSEIALFYGLTRIAVVLIAFGSLITLVVGFWLVVHEGFSFGDLWIVLAIILWFAAVGMGQAGGMRDRETRLLADELAAGTNVATPELRARMRDPRTLALSYGSGLALLVILALMIWKPGA